MTDLFVAIRSLARAPLVAAVAVVTIGLGVGAVATLFSVFDAVWLEPLPMREPDRLAAVTLRNEHGQAIGMSSPNFHDLRERTRAFETLSAFNLAELTATASGRPEPALAHQVLGDFFELVGLETALGRGLRPEDDAPGAEPVIVLSHHYWTNRFGGDADILGTTVDIEGTSYRNVERQRATVVGVLRPQAWFHRRVDLWMPFHLVEKERTDRGAISYWLFGRLADGVGWDDARIEMQTLLGDLAREYPDDNRGLTIELEDAYAWLYGDERTTVTFLLGAASLLLLIACGNVAHLLLARATERRRELALRTALGAGRVRLIGFLSFESALLLLGGGALGLVVASSGIAAAAAALPRSLVDNLPRGAADVSLDTRVFAFAVLAATISVIAASWLPMWKATKLDLVSALKASSSGDTAKTRFQPLIVSEVALSLVLLVAAGVTLRSTLKLESAPLGFDPEGVVDFWVTPSKDRYPGPAERRAFYRDVRRAVAGLPEIDTVGFTNRFPHQMWSSRHEFEVVAGDASPPTADVRAVDAGYFEIMRITLARGRHFDERDSELSQPVALVNHHLAERFWPNADPIGKNVTLFVDDVPVSLSVIGVVADVHVPLRAEVHPIIYRPWQQAAPVWIDVLIRPEVFSESLAEAVRQRIWSVDPNHSISMAMVDGSHIWFARTRFAATLLGAFSAVAFMLSAAGVFAVVSSYVGRRKREMGIRKAVGATESDLRRLVVGRAVGQALVGIAIGLIGAAAGTRFLVELLYVVEPMDGVSTLAASAALMAAVACASWIPARRLSRVHPTEVLRSD